MSRSDVLRIVGVAVALLAVPAVAMGITDEVDWGPLDFVVAAALLIVAGAATVHLTRKTADQRRRALIAAGVALALATVWAVLAVGFD